MLINNFSDGTREKYLRFTSNGSRTVTIDVPRGAVVREAVLELEAQELPDSEVIRIGLLKNCSLSDFNALEERLESTSWGRNTVRPGWGASERTSFLVGETGRYRVIPIDPSSMVGAHPSFYRREFDVVIIPNGPLRADLTSLLNSSIPVITMDSRVAEELGLCRERSLHAAITNFHIGDRKHYVCEQFRDENILAQGRGGGRSDQILVDAVEPVDESSRGLVDTGVPVQSIIVTGMERKYAYAGFSRVEQLLRDGLPFTMFRRLMEWCSIGGYITNLGLDVCGLPGGFKKPGRFSEITETPDLSEKIVEHMASSKPSDDGSYPIALTFYSDSPGILILSNLRVRCVFPTVIRQFADGEGEARLDFDSVETDKFALVELPAAAEIKSASLKVEGMLSRERIGIASASEDEGNVFGVTVSSRYTVAQQFSPGRVMTVSRIGLNLSDPQGDAEAEMEIRLDHLDVPAEEVLARAVVGSRELDKDYRWVDASMEGLVLEPERKYWILLRSKRGRVHWHADRNCPLGGSLRFTKDGGKNWTDHDMDSLFKVYYVMESYEDSPSFSLNPSGVPLRGYPGEFQQVHNIPDFTASLGEYLSSHQRELKSADIIQVPLYFTARSIGCLRLFDLEITCELPDRESKEKVEGVSVGEELSSILELIGKLNMRVTELIKVLPKDVIDPPPQS